MWAYDIYIKDAVTTYISSLILNDVLKKKYFIGIV
jgi:hypothetical protein